LDGDIPSRVREKTEEQYKSGIEISTTNAGKEKTMSTSLTGEKIANWQVTCDAIESELTNFPEVQEHHADLIGFIEEGEALQVQQRGLMSQLRIINRRRREIAEDGEQLRMRISAALQAKLGFRNELLISFGVKPRRTPRRTTPVDPPPEAPAPPPEQSEQPDNQ
jgi:hypothetical protein